MVSKIQRLNATSTEAKQPKGELFYRFHNVKLDSFDSNEVKERHGAQYHHRHHLSGCAQTLHTVDFANDFSPPVLEQSALTSSITSEPPPSSADSPGSKLFNENSTNSSSFTPFLRDTPSLVDTLTLTPGSALTSSGEAKTLHTIPTILEISDTPLVVGGRFESVEISDIDGQNENSPSSMAFIANFDNLSLDDWILREPLNAEQILEDGRLHFNERSLHEGEPLLSHEFELIENQHYVFQMSLLINESSEPPCFIINISGENHEMKINREGDHFVMKAEFISISSEKVNLTIIPVDLGSLKYDIWLDDFILQPTGPTQSNSELSLHMAIMEPELFLDFSHINEATDENKSVIETSLKIPMVLNTVEPELFVAEEPVQHETSFSQDAENLVNATHSKLWNQISCDNCALGVTVALEAATTTALEEIDIKNIIN
ncbi:hypothetical protein [Pantoea sp. JK]|uniref:hypothetical protein n=1 Tax=Pantoea sp. JK TaxID=2871703 RepID=UPI0022386F27|nr:hypothetical protein [Pantoea sp. JK]MCW6034647.1 hypothetical protein [Pantoea sp. JK]